MVVVSRLGAGRAGCFCAVAVAYELLKDPSDTPQPFDYDSNLLDSVLRGVRSQRAGLVSNLRQFQFCHHMLGEALWGGTEETDADSGKKKEGGRWKRFWKKKGSMDGIKEVEHIRLSLTHSGGRTSRDKNARGKPARGKSKKTEEQPLVNRGTNDLMF